jgi:hypothetical protein
MRSSSNDCQSPASPLDGGQRGEEYPVSFGDPPRTSVKTTRDASADVAGKPGKTGRRMTRHVIEPIRKPFEQAESAARHRHKRRLSTIARVPAGHPRFLFAGQAWQ